VDTRQLGSVIRDRRGALNHTQPDLAERAGVSVAYLYMLEVGGIPQPGLEPLLRVAAALRYGRLVTLLEDVRLLKTEGQLPPSVEDLATSKAVDQFLHELPGANGLPHRRARS
jgi:transcriptional regulator with XRE-family HTH domain